MFCDTETRGGSAVVDVIYLGIIAALFLATLGLAAAIDCMEVGS
jgi:hypothetical protein